MPLPHILTAFSVALILQVDVSVAWVRGAESRRRGAQGRRRGEIEGIRGYCCYVLKHARLRHILQPCVFIHEGHSSEV